MVEGMRLGCVGTVLCALTHRRYELTQWAQQGWLCWRNCCHYCCCELLITFPRITTLDRVSGTADGGAYGCIGGCSADGDGSASWGKELIPSHDPHLGGSFEKFSVRCLKLNGLLDPLNLRLYELNTSCGNNYVEQSQEEIISA
ncbi:hypothetical protein M0802_006437 [Mischocyttarus mexicanus]|nr:hypothetical protein M0802_006437 [Mischocyttarus mexicanus]